MGKKNNTFSYVKSEMKNILENKKIFIPVFLNIDNKSMTFKRVVNGEVIQKKSTYEITRLDKFTLFNLLKGMIAFMANNDKIFNKIERQELNKILNQLTEKVCQKQNCHENPLSFQFSYYQEK